MGGRRTRAGARHLANGPIFGLTLGALISFAEVAAAAPALPMGGQVAAGSASIAKTSASTLTVDQTSSRAIVTWSSFSIGQGGAVDFDNGSGATLNRVTGGSLTSIDGLLSATGSVYLINPNGVIIGKDGVVDTGGSFVASTQDLTNASFMTGGTLTFSGNSTASVLNLGKVGSLGGDVALIASAVENDGSITAKDGDVGLAAGYQVVMADATQNDGKFQVLVGGSGTSATNTGSIQAAEAELRANGGNVYALAGNTGSVIEATGVSNTDGKVLLIAEDGTVTANGTLRATGEVETSGQTVSFAGLTVKAGTWLVDPTDLTVNTAAATSIDNSLAAGTSVTLETTASGASGPGVTSSGAGDITIASALGWTTAATLTLDALNAIAIDAPVTVSGAGAVNLRAAVDTTLVSGASLLELTFAVGDSINYGPTDKGGALTINGQAYTLLYALSLPGSTGPDDGTDDIAGIDNNAAAGGLKGYYALATSVTQPNTQVFTGPLVAPGDEAYSGYFQGVFEGLGNTISNLTINDPTNGDRVALFANLALPGATIRDLGLIGGSVTLTGTGVTNQNGYVAGIVANSNGIVANVWSSGAVSGAAGDTVGGVVGMNEDGAIVDSFATGAISGAGGDVGGLAGANHSYSGPAGFTIATIIDSYATGPVSGGAGSSAGGLVGSNDSCCGNGVIIDSYATGAVSGAGSLIGGLAGGGSGDSITDGYYDASTTGMALGTQGNGSVGMATAALQGALPTFQDAVWSTGTGLYPYLRAFFPNGVQAVSGFAYADAGTTPLTASSVGAVANGVNLGSATAGANGYYYILAPAGSVASGSSVLAYGNDAATLTTATGADNTSVNLYGEAVTLPTTASSLSTTPTLAEAQVLALAADGGVAAAAAAIDDATGRGLVSSAPSFAIDEAVNTSAVLFVQTTAANAPITVSHAITLAGAGSLGLDAAGDLTIDAPIRVTGAGAVALGYSAALPSNLSFDLGPTGFAGSLSYAAGSGEGIAGQALTINGTAYTLIYSMSQLADLDGGPGSDALALSLIAPTTAYTTGGVVGFDSGTFEGLGNTITGLTVSGNAFAGLFASLSIGGVVRDIGLVGGTMAAVGGGDAGSLVAENYGLVEQDYATTAVGGYAQVGGLVGDNEGRIAQSFATGSVNVIDAGGGQNVGGLVGFNEGAIEQDYATGAVTGGAGSLGVGGLVGANASGVIEHSYATGAVSGSQVVGGLVGYNHSTILDSYSGAATVSGSYSIGGLAGDNDGTIEGGSNSSDTVSGIAYVGGLVGYNDNGGAIEQAHATGAVSGGADSSDLGGLVGENLSLATIDQSYATGAVSGGAGSLYVGGLVGFNASEITASSARTGSVSGYGFVGGLVGENSGTIEGGAFASDSASGTGDVGGLAGFNSGAITGASATGSVTGTSHDIGGLAGYNAAAGVIDDDAASGATVSGADYVGGLIGENHGTVEGGSSSSDAVSGTAGVGGLAGYNAGVIIGSSATGNVGGAYAVGGLVGVNLAGATITADTSSGASVSGGNFAGGLVGENLGTIETGSSSSDAVSGASHVGGLAGYNSGTITDAIASGSVSATGYEAGGLVGENFGTIGGSSAGTGSVSGSAFVGGLAGYNAAAGVLSGDAASGASVSASDYAGGLVGRNYGTINGGSHSSDAVTGEIEVGGLAGSNDGSISDASASGSVTGLSDAVNIGGLAGYNAAGGTITDASASGGAVSASAGEYLGGLVGRNDGAIAKAFATESVASAGSGTGLGGLVGLDETTGQISNTYTTGSVGAGTNVGGLVGNNAGVVRTSWADGAVAAGATSGGVAGANTSSGVFTDVYWDEGTTGRASALGAGTLGASTNVTGIGGTTGRNPDSQATYTGLNFTSVWTINPGASRPYLQAVTPQTPPH